MSYEELIAVLKSNHFYPKMVMKKNVIVGLEVYAPPLQADARLFLLRDLCGLLFDCQHFPNEDKITVTEVKKSQPVKQKKSTDLFGNEI